MARALSAIATQIATEWNKIPPPARPYLIAMSGLRTLDDTYIADDAVSIVTYFLSNATTWRGANARRIKAELNKMLKEHRR